MEGRRASIQPIMLKLLLTSDSTETGFFISYRLLRSLKRFPHMWPTCKIILQVGHTCGNLLIWTLLPHSDAPAVAIDVRRFSAVPETTPI